MNRELLMLAKDYDPEKHSIADCYVSIKLDGQRCWWDGGITRGLVKNTVPWANNKKDERYKETVYATGLWSRYGNVIHAPDSWLDQLPKGLFLDGELYLGRGKFQEGRSIISTLVPDPEKWSKVQFRVFDIPSPNVLFQAGQVNNPNMSLYIDEDECNRFYSNRVNSLSLEQHTRKVLTFEETVLRMRKMSPSGPWSFVNQVRLSYRETEAINKMIELLDAETNLGGEGLMIRRPESMWVPKRVQNLLKIKKFIDDEGTIVGYQFGLGKYLGMLGALVVEWQGKRFNLSGFTDEERQLTVPDVAKQCPGELYSGSVNISRIFKYGDKVRFRYRVLTDDGYPREARYWR